jgi:phage I-like protein
VVGLVECRVEGKRRRRSELERVPGGQSHRGRVVPADERYERQLLEKPGVFAQRIRMGP